MSDPTTLTSKGQVTVPQDIRQRLGLKAGDKIAFTFLDDGTVILRPKNLRPADVAGLLYRQDQQRVPTEALRMGPSTPSPVRRKVR